MNVSRREFLQNLVALGGGVLLLSNDIENVIPRPVVGATTWDVSRPTLLLRGAPGKYVVLEQLMLVQMGLPAGGAITTCVAVDKDVRSPFRWLSRWFGVASRPRIQYQPKIWRDPATMRVLAQYATPPSLGMIAQINFKDGILVGPNDRLLIYTHAATPAPRWSACFAFKEISNNDRGSRAVFVDHGSGR